LWSLTRWLLAVAFLPYDAYNSLDAILTTLYRLLISRRHLLQWTTAAQTAHLFGLQAYRTTIWLRMLATTLLAIFLVGAIQVVHLLTGDSGLAPSLLLSAPLLILWIVSPLVDRWISLPVRRESRPLNDAQVELFRTVARRTWGFFERFVGPEDHWLPPDHFQEDPVGIIAHRTSPTNIGLLFTSTLAAFELGYLDQFGLATRFSITLDTLGQLERFRGHFLNWYDTLTLQPLKPRYISTIDSGNLAACLVVITQACLSMTRQRIFRWALWQGYLDTLSNLTEILKGMPKGEFEPQVDEIHKRIIKIREEILLVRTDPGRWFSLFQEVGTIFWPDLSQRIIELLTAGRAAFNLDAIRNLQEVASQVGRHHQTLQRTLSDLVPWIEHFDRIPELFTETQYKPTLSSLRARLPYNPRLGQIQKHITNAQECAAVLRQQLETGSSPSASAEQVSQALEWLDSLEKSLSQAGKNAAELLIMYASCAERAGQYVQEMDFRFLYNPQRRVFHNGFNLDTGQLDNNYYDILASEARIASIIALAKGEVPQSHWLQLSRPLTRVQGNYVLLSWSATMFEYLMPPLFLRSYPGTLLAESSQGAVQYQIAYAKDKGVPWGISESGFYLFDANQNYQYRAFGVPGLGFKRGLGDDLVVSPYASLMAINYNPYKPKQLYLRRA
jgi:cyclic beta-1,2-glucan synthetase